MVFEKELTAEALIEQCVTEIEKSVTAFETSFWFKQLTQSEQADSLEIIFSFGECMFDYHFQLLGDWSSYATEDVILRVLPYELVGDVSFFKKVIPTLVRYFEFLYYHEGMEQGLGLSLGIRKLSNSLLAEVAYVHQQNEGEEALFQLGEEMGLDVSSYQVTQQLFRLAQRVQEVNELPRLSLVPRKKHA